MSESVTNLLDRLECGLDDYANRERTMTVVKMLTNLEKELDSVCQILGNLRPGFAELDQEAAERAQLPVGELAEACRAAAMQIRKHRGAPHQSPGVERKVSDLASEAEKAIKEAWRDYINRSIPGWESLNSLTEVLTRAHVDVGQVANLRQTVARIRDLSKRLPGEGSRAQLTVEVQTLRTAVTVLIGDDQGDSEVQRFVRGVAAGGAHVDTLTPGVRAWIREKDIEGSFKIVLDR